MKEDTKDITVHIRMNEKEINKIKSRAKKTGKNFSEFIRDSAMGCEIKEKPDKEFFDLMNREIGKFLRTVSQLERLVYHKDFIDERILNEEIAEWRKFRMQIKERYL